MHSRFDRRILGDEPLAFVQACQRRVSCRLAGGVALAGAHLSHRLSNDVDLFCESREDVRDLARTLGDAAAEVGGTVESLRDAGTYLRHRVHLPRGPLEVDVALDPPLDPAAPHDELEGVQLVPLAELRAAKLTCILSRSEPRDLVDLYFLDRAGHPPEADIPLALQKDGGLDPGILGWLLKQFPTFPLPQMLERLDEGELVAFRDALCERFRRLSVPPFV